ncbi:MULTISPECIES: TetR/AcrR family transcriptional regulator [Cryobacterium]|uniref:TetR family transcriptional regulator n=1 Tax=Cryobacterium zongtaii TaxID=1259217 RepID=A0A2S3ZE43_9MICO|nr:MULTISPECIES: TetR/AcrR family transcriptional regulator [Cryobacterium]POH64824.1 TetR family transcriptional regulator [Cryobacterium zongtaii]POH65157.1 TetR family transcriptional regulator [Cryobacterium zongtaii]TFC44779.1 TetR/AcrR family transcriptional regulator [Cryobacterium sp. TMN-39-2]
MAQHRDSARESILTAFQELLIDTSGSGASLDAVARAAGVTKGGLLYHFGSRDGLETALIDRLERLADAEYERMRAAPAGAAASYVAMAEYVNSPLDRATLAGGSLARRNPRAHAVIVDMRRRYFDILNEDLRDPDLARATMLLADGLYYDATTIGEPFEHELDIPAFLARLTPRTVS